MLPPMARLPPFPWLNNIHIVYVPLSLICSSIDVYLGCFHVLAIVNNAAVNMGVHISFQVRVFIFFGKFSEVELLNHMVILFLISFFK